MVQRVLSKTAFKKKMLSRSLCNFGIVRLAYPLCNTSVYKLSCHHSSSVSCVSLPHLEGRKGHKVYDLNLFLEK